jgi:hypothetical protein
MWSSRRVVPRERGPQDVDARPAVDLAAEPEVKIAMLGAVKKTMVPGDGALACRLARLE